MKIKNLLIVSILLFTGCGTKNSLTCTKKEKHAGYDYEETYEFTYDNDDIKKINLKANAIFNEQYTDDEINEELEYLEKYCSVFDLSDEGVIKCTVNREDNIIDFVAFINTDKITDEEFESFMYVAKEEISNSKKTKKMLQNVGYTCK